MRNKTSTLLASIIIVVLGATAGYAAEQQWSATVDSGGKAKYFDTPRTSTQTVKLSLLKTTDGGGVRADMVNCDSYGIWETGSVTAYSGQGFKSFTSDSKNKCFRLRMSRANPKDTNGTLGWGMGTTKFSGKISW